MPSPPESPAQSHGSWPGGGRLVGAAAGGGGAGGGAGLAATCGCGGGGGGFGLDWKPVAGDYSVDVVVTGQMLGTRWNYAMACPR